MANLAYSKFHSLVRQNPRLDDIYVFGSSSKGNSIYFKNERFLIDLGFSYKHYQDYDFNFFLKVDYIFLTHEHSDHFNPRTMFHIVDTYPNVKFIISTNMWEDLLAPSFAHRIDQEKLIASRSHFYIAKPMILYNRRNLAINYCPHVTAHGPITNCAVELTFQNCHLLYASDLDEYQANPSRGTQGLPFDHQNPFDILCLEANYDPKILYNYIQKHPNDFRAKQNFRHTSEQDAWNYVEQFLKSNGLFIPLHASHAFGTLWQDIDGTYADHHDDNFYY